jgi:GrpB-like predicted nucleotidyltransferase (UPF0157 family)
VAVRAGRGANEPDADRAAILHVRLLGAPWWAYTVAFRDWLRGSPDARRAYEAMKERVAADHAGDADYDDYTRGKTAFFGEWRQARAGPGGSEPPAVSG